MADNHVYLSDLNTSSKNYNVKVKVIEKTRPKMWSRNGLPYQNLLFVDEQGTKMRGVLFGVQIELYKDALMYNGFYKISNAPIKNCRTEHATGPTDRKCIMLFNRLTDIQPLDIDSIQNNPKYQHISQIPKNFDTAARYDVVAIVLFVEERPHTITTPQGKDYAVRELVIVDQSTEQPLLIAAWHDLAYAQCDFLQSKAAKLQMVGFTALKTSKHKGFSMTTTLSTTFIPSPTGDKPTALAHWRNQNQNKLTEMQESIYTGRRAFPNKFRTTIAALQNKQAYNVTHDEKYILNIVIPEPSLENINAYIGCCECDYATDTQLEDSYYCTNCSTDNVISLPRITFNCQVTDSTGCLAITAFTTDTEKFLQMQAADIFRMKHTEDTAAFEPLKIRLQTHEIMIVVAPTTNQPTTNNVLWQLDSIEHHCKHDAEKKTPENSSKGNEGTKEEVPSNRTAQSIEDMKYNDSKTKVKIESDTKAIMHTTETTASETDIGTQLTSTPHIGHK